MPRSQCTCMDNGFFDRGKFIIRVLFQWNLPAGIGTRPLNCVSHVNIKDTVIRRYKVIGLKGRCTFSPLLVSLHHYYLFRGCQNPFGGILIFHTFGKCMYNYFNGTKTAAAKSVTCFKVKRFWGETYSRQNEQSRDVSVTLLGLMKNKYKEYIM